MPEPADSSLEPRTRRVAVIGAGPAGLMAAETLARAGMEVEVHEAMASPARKFLMAGRGGLNLTHSEPIEQFIARYGDDPRIVALVRRFSPDALRQWAEGLGQPLFIGSSGRVFPRAMKASPLLRAWLERLRGLGVAIRTASRWQGWDAGGRPFGSGPAGPWTLNVDAIVLALGGASWPRLGSDGQWSGALAIAGVTVRPFAASNAGIRVDWSARLLEVARGQPLKGVRISLGDANARGDAMVTATGLEGGPVYALGPAIRAALARGPSADLRIDLKADTHVEALAGRLARTRAGQSIATRLRGAAGLSPAAAALVFEAGKPPADPIALARVIKAVPVRATGLQGLERAISSIGGVDWDCVDERMMLRALAGVFVAGEMLDWDAPTGGYLLQACFASGVAAAEGVLDWLEGQPSS